MVFPYLLSGTTALSKYVHTGYDYLFLVSKEKLRDVKKKKKRQRERERLKRILKEIGKRERTAFERTRGKVCSKGRRNCVGDRNCGFLISLSA